MSYVKDHDIFDATDGGLQIILEQGISGPTKKLLKLFGSTSDETIDVLSRNVEFDNLIKASYQFAKLGLTEVDS
jgi:hypothetical protein